MPAVSLVSVHVHPLKAARALDVSEAVVEPWGLAGDRRWMLVDGEGRQLTQREEPRLALLDVRRQDDGGLVLSGPGHAPCHVPVPAGESAVVQLFRDKVEVVPAADAASAWCAAYLRRPVRLVHLGAPATARPVDPVYARPGDTVSLADGYPLLLTSTASLDALNSLIAVDGLSAEGPVPMNRFRPNLVVSGGAPWAEDGWERVRIGEVLFRVTKPCGRCVVTTVDQATAVRGKEPLRTLARHRRREGKAMFGMNLVPESAGSVRVGDRLTVVGASGTGAVA
ncbi:MOSC N-terminal beta barrel domain-containing protein [Streptomyces sp. SID11385]|uniref:MOSC domain-containing protein n=1 Tax=Streptomyces sp. SID11385 TaxID=2706031 RepID=UPI0013C8F36B|nr:MOSC N-terminal beta barrel domain-containing protein [Streptomyces sp. SID11385]NEA39139.1 MOSC domain-containing protein [Streptomyces sp. SID11385]